MISLELFVLLFYLGCTATSDYVPEKDHSLVTSIMDNPIWIKIFQSVDEATNDEHLLDVTLKLLKSLCVCMSETLKEKEQNLFTGDNNNLQIENNSQNSGKDVLDLYTKMYNNTCFDLRQDLLSKINKMHEIVENNDDSEIMIKSTCGKTMERTTETVVQTSPVVRDNIRSKLSDVLVKALIETKQYHKYTIKISNLFKRFQPPTSSDLKHSVIVILTLYQKNVDQDNKEANLSPKVTDRELNTTLFNQSPIDIDIMETNFSFDIDKKQTPAVNVARECQVQSIYYFLKECEKNNSTKVFRLLRKKNTIKIYIKVDTVRNYTDYSSMCCKNGDLCRSYDYSVNKNDLSKSNKDRLLKTLSKIKSFVKMYDEKKMKIKEMPFSTEAAKSSHSIPEIIKQSSGSKISTERDFATTKLENHIWKNYIDERFNKKIPSNNDTTKNIAAATSVSSKYFQRVDSMDQTQNIISDENVHPKAEENTYTENIDYRNKSDKEVLENLVDVGDKKIEIDESTRMRFLPNSDKFIATNSFNNREKKYLPHQEYDTTEKGGQVTMVENNNKLITVSIDGKTAPAESETSFHASVYPLSEKTYINPKSETESIFKNVTIEDVENNLTVDFNFNTNYLDTQFENMDSNHGNLNDMVLRYKEIDAINKKNRLTSKNRDSSNVTKNEFYATLIPDSKTSKTYLTILLNEVVTETGDRSNTDSITILETSKHYQNIDKISSISNDLAVTKTSSIKNTEPIRGSESSRDEQNTDNQTADRTISIVHDSDVTGTSSFSYTEPITSINDSETYKEKNTNTTISILHSSTVTENSRLSNTELVTLKTSLETSRSKKYNEKTTSTSHNSADLKTKSISNTDPRNKTDTITFITGLETSRDQQNTDRTPLNLYDSAITKVNSFSNTEQKAVINILETSRSHENTKGITVSLHDPFVTKNSNFSYMTTLKGASKPPKSHEYNYLPTRTSQDSTVTKISSFNNTHPITLITSSEMPRNHQSHDEITLDDSAVTSGNSYGNIEPTILITSTDTSENYENIDVSTLIVHDPVIITNSSFSYTKPTTTISVLDTPWTQDNTNSTSSTLHHSANIKTSRFNNTHPVTLTTGSESSRNHHQDTDRITVILHDSADTKFNSFNDTEPIISTTSLETSRSNENTDRTTSTVNDSVDLITSSISNTDPIIKTALITLITGLETSRYQQSTDRTTLNWYDSHVIKVDRFSNTKQIPVKTISEISRSREDTERITLSLHDPFVSKNSNFSYMTPVTLISASETPKSHEYSDKSSPILQDSATTKTSSFNNIHPITSITGSEIPRNQQSDDEIKLALHDSGVTAGNNYGNIEPTTLATSSDTSEDYENIDRTTLILHDPVTTTNGSFSNTMPKNLKSVSETSTTHESSKRTSSTFHHSAIIETSSLNNTHLVTFTTGSETSRNQHQDTDRITMSLHDSAESSFSKKVPIILPTSLETSRSIENTDNNTSTVHDSVDLITSSISYTDPIDKTDHITLITSLETSRNQYKTDRNTLNLYDSAVTKVNNFSNTKQKDVITTPEMSRSREGTERITLTLHDPFVTKNSNLSYMRPKTTINVSKTPRSYEYSDKSTPNLQDSDVTKTSSFYNPITLITGSEIPINQQNNDEITLALHDSVVTTSNSYDNIEPTTLVTSSETSEDYENIDRTTMILHDSVNTINGSFSYTKPMTSISGSETYKSQEITNRTSSTLHQSAIIETSSFNNTHPVTLTTGSKSLRNQHQDTERITLILHDLANTETIISTTSLETSRSKENIERTISILDNPGDTKTSSSNTEPITTTTERKNMIKNLAHMKTETQIQPSALDSQQASSIRNNSVTKKSQISKEHKTVSKLEYATDVILDYSEPYSEEKETASYLSVNNKIAKDKDYLSPTKQNSPTPLINKIVNTINIEKNANKLMKTTKIMNVSSSWENSTITVTESMMNFENLSKSIMASVTKSELQINNISPFSNTSEMNVELFTSNDSPIKQKTKRLVNDKLSKYIENYDNEIFTKINTQSLPLSNKLENMDMSVKVLNTLDQKTSNSVQEITEFESKRPKNVSINKTQMYLSKQNSKAFLPSHMTDNTNIDMNSLPLPKGLPKADIANKSLNKNISTPEELKFTDQYLTRQMTTNVDNSFREQNSEKFQTQRINQRSANTPIHSYDMFKDGTSSEYAKSLTTNLEKEESQTTNDIIFITNPIIEKEIIPKIKVTSPETPFSNHYDVTKQRENNTDSILKSKTKMINVNSNFAFDDNFKFQNNIADTKFYPKSIELLEKPDTSIEDTKNYFNDALLLNEQHLNSFSNYFTTTKAYNDQNIDKQNLTMGNFKSLLTSTNGSKNNKQIILNTEAKQHKQTKKENSNRGFSDGLKKQNNSMTSEVDVSVMYPSKLPMKSSSATVFSKSVSGKTDNINLNETTEVNTTFKALNESLEPIVNFVITDKNIPTFTSYRDNTESNNFYEHIATTRKNTTLQNNSNESEEFYTTTKTNKYNTTVINNISLSDINKTIITTEILKNAITSITNDTNQSFRFTTVLANSDNFFKNPRESLLTTKFYSTDNKPSHYDEKQKPVLMSQTTEFKDLISVANTPSGTLINFSIHPTSIKTMTTTEPAKLQIVPSFIKEATTELGIPFSSINPQLLDFNTYARERDNLTHKNSFDRNRLSSENTKNNITRILDHMLNYTTNDEYIGIQKTTPKVKNDFLINARRSIKHHIDQFKQNTRAGISAQSSLYTVTDKLDKNILKQNRITQSVKFQNNYNDFISPSQKNHNNVHQFTYQPSSYGFVSTFKINKLVDFKLKMTPLSDKNLGKQSFAEKMHPSSHTNYKPNSYIDQFSHREIKKKLKISNDILRNEVKNDFTKSLFSKDAEIISSSLTYTPTASNWRDPTKILYKHGMKTLEGSINREETSTGSTNKTNFDNLSVNGQPTVKENWKVQETKHKTRSFEKNSKIPMITVPISATTKRMSKFNENVTTMNLVNIIESIIEEGKENFVETQITTPSLRRKTASLEQNEIDEDTFDEKKIQNTFEKGKTIEYENDQQNKNILNRVTHTLQDPLQPIKVTNITNIQNKITSSPNDLQTSIKRYGSDFIEGYTISSLKTVDENTIKYNDKDELQKTISQRYQALIDPNIGSSQTRNSTIYDTEIITEHVLDSFNDKMIHFNNLDLVNYTAKDLLKDNKANNITKKESDIQKTVFSFEDTVNNMLTDTEKHYNKMTVTEPTTRAKTDIFKVTQRAPNTKSLLNGLTKERLITLSKIINKKRNSSHTDTTTFELGQTSYETMLNETELFDTTYYDGQYNLLLPNITAKIEINRFFTAKTNKQRGLTSTIKTILKEESSETLPAVPYYSSVNVSNNFEVTTKTDLTAPFQKNSAFMDVYKNKETRPVDANNNRDSTAKFHIVTSNTTIRQNKHDEKIITKKTHKKNTHYDISNSKKFLKRLLTSTDGELNKATTDVKQNTLSFTGTWLRSSLGLKNYPTTTKTLAIGRTAKNNKFDLSTQELNAEIQDTETITNLKTIKILQNKSMTAKTSILENEVKALPKYLITDVMTSKINAYTTLNMNLSQPMKTSITEISPLIDIQKTKVNKTNEVPLKTTVETYDISFMKHYNEHNQLITNLPSWYPENSEIPSLYSSLQTDNKINHITVLKTHSSTKPPETIHPNLTFSKYFVPFTETNIYNISVQDGAISTNSLLNKNSHNTSTSLFHSQKPNTDSYSDLSVGKDVYNNLKETIITKPYFNTLEFGNQNSTTLRNSIFPRTSNSLKTLWKSFAESYIDNVSNLVSVSNVTKSIVNHSKDEIYATLPISVVHKASTTNAPTVKNQEFNNKLTSSTMFLNGTSKGISDHFDTLIPFTNSKRTGYILKGKYITDNEKTLKKISVTSDKINNYVRIISEAIKKSVDNTGKKKKSNLNQTGKYVFSSLGGEPTENLNILKGSNESKLLSTLRTLATIYRGAPTRRQNMNSKIITDLKNSTLSSAINAIDKNGATNGNTLTSIQIGNLTYWNNVMGEKFNNKNKTSTFQYNKYQNTTKQYDVDITKISIGNENKTLPNSSKNNTLKNFYILTRRSNHINTTSNLLKESTLKYGAESLTLANMLKTVRYNTYRPTNLEDLEIVSNVEARINLFKNNLASVKEELFEDPLKIKNTTSCAMLRDFRLHINQAVTKFNELVKAFNCSENSMTTIKNVSKKNLLVKSPKITILNKNLKQFKNKSIIKKPLLDPFAKTNLYPIKKELPRNRHKIVKTIRLGKNKEIMTMNNQEFFANRRFATKSPPSNNQFKFFQPFLRLPPTTQMPHIILRPKFDQIDKVKSRPKFNLKIENDDNFYRYDYAPHHQPKLSWKDKIHFMQQVFDAPAMIEKSEENVESVISRPGSLQPTQPRLLKDQPQLLRDRVDSIRRFLKPRVVKHTTLEEVGTSISLIDSDEIHREFDYEFPFRKNDWEATTTTTAKIRLMPFKGTTLKKPRRTRSRKTLYFLSPTVPYNRYF